MKFLLLLFTINCLASFKELPLDELYKYNSTKSKKKTRSKIQRFRNPMLSELKKSDKEILEILKRQEKNLNIKTSKDGILALARFKGKILNSIISLNIKPSKFIVQISDKNSELHGSEVRCQGISFQKRVLSKCDLLVHQGQEYQVDIEIWGLDGAEGVKADYFYTGKEKELLTSTFASLIGTTFNVAKGGINSPVGNISNNNAKNQLLNGLVGASDNIKESIRNAGQQNIEISFVNSGKEILVFFNESLTIDKEN